MNAYIARQPIFDQDYNVVAYELLYRDSLENVFSGRIADDVATSLVLVNSYFNFGIEKITGGTKAFVNFDKSLILHGIPELVNKAYLTIEILESVQPDPQLLKKLKQLRRAGYTIALDDYSLDYPFDEMLDYVDLVKVDFMDASPEDLTAVVQKLKKLDKKLLAEKVETKEAFEWAKLNGFEYFQGFYFARPSVETKRKMGDSGLNYVRLMQALDVEEPDYGDLSEIIMLDATLTYKLLKLANANMKPINEITSIRQALVVLGVNHFKRWLTMAMMDSMTSKETSEAFKYAMIRSNLLNRISQKSDMDQYEDELTLLGILSVLDVLLEMQMSDILETLPIAQTMKDTLMGEETLYTDAMRLCLAYEKGAFDMVEVSAKRIHYPWEKLPEDYVAAISWAEQTFRSMKEKSND